jgi:hypothetical protein
MKSRDIADLKAQLATRALSVCQHYLSNGHRLGNYWIVGDARNAPGRSMYVHLQASNTNMIGCWNDEATGEYGDLLDIIRFSRPDNSFACALENAKRWVGDPIAPRPIRFRVDRKPTDNRSRQAQWLYHASLGLRGTFGETYLLNRSIDPAVANGLRFSPSCYCRPTAENDRRTWPALIAPVTNWSGALTGVHRVYLDPDGFDGPNQGKAPLERPKRSLGPVAGGVVQFGSPGELVVVGEGIETVLSLRTLFPWLTVHSALTAGNLARYGPHPATKRLLIAGDNDNAGRLAAGKLLASTKTKAIDAFALWPTLADFNADLQQVGADSLRTRLLGQANVENWLRSASTHDA